MKWLIFVTMIAVLPFAVWILMFFVTIWMGAWVELYDVIKGGK